jgi:predicted alpha/beta-fold hydrolase
VFVGLRVLKVGRRRGVKRVELELVPGLRVEFTDRERALGQVVEWAERGARFPVVIFGPEGCGKSAFLWQVSAMLRELGFDVFYLHWRGSLGLRWRCPAFGVNLCSLWRGPLARTP